MEGSSHTMTAEPLLGDSIIQVEMKHLNEGNSRPTNDVPTPIHGSKITEESINSLQRLKEKLLSEETDTTNRKLESRRIPIRRLQGLKDELLCIERDATNKTMGPNNICIPRVPQWLRENKANSKCFDPAVVSIGPYHHGKSKLARIEELKVISAWRFITGCKSSIEDIYNELESLTSEARTYYNDSIMANFDNEAFTVMMLLDGCFILDFIAQVEFDGGEWNMLMTLGNDIPLISRDLLLLENQLPYLILKKLMDCDRGLENMVYNYINSEIGKTYGMRGFYGCIINSEIGKTRMRSSPSAGQNRDQKMPLLPCILDLFRANLVCNPFFRSQSGQEPWERWERSKQSNPPVKELLSKGITFKRKNSSCLCDVEFRSHLLSGEILLPQIEINHYTKDRFLNLIAYELSYDIPELSYDNCPFFIPKHAFIAFICFLDTLIDHADDVKVLRSEGIICNYLGSDEEVANLINQLATELIPDASAYSEVADEIHSFTYSKKVQGPHR